jgi:hypothetical protein
MTGRVIAALACVIAAGLSLASGALAYGTTTTYASSGSATTGAWANVAAAGSAADGGAAATLTEADAGSVPATDEPSNRTFSGSITGWTAADAPSGLCSISSGYDGSTGNPAGAARSSYGALLNLLGLLGNCSATWTSTSFTWAGGAPASVAFSMDRLVDLNGLIGGVTASWTATLVDETAPGSRTLLSGSVSSDSGWATVSAAGLPASAIASGHTYHVAVKLAFSSSLSLVSNMGVDIDNVVLAITPHTYAASGELDVPGVPAGSSQTLELSARTTGEPFDLQLWDGSGWTTRATVSSTSYAPLSYGLTAAEWNGGSVRARLVADGTGTDATQDVLSVDYLRVVSTGGITVSGPTSVSLPDVTIDGVAPQTSSGPMGAIDVVDSGGGASGWTLGAVATRWALTGAPSTLLPAGALTATPAAPTSPSGSSLAGVSAGARGVVDTTVPLTLMRAAPGAGVGTFRQNPTLSLQVPVSALKGTYASDITLSVS